MNGKQRVEKAIRHEIPDRVPTGEWGIDHDHVSKIIGHHTYWRNRKDETIALWEGRRDEVVESYKQDCVELVEKLDYDVITVGLMPPKGYRHPDPPRKIGDGLWEDSKGNRYKYAASNDSIMSFAQRPAIEEVSDEQIEEKIASLASFDESRFELVEFICQKYAGEKAILFRGIDIYGCLMGIFGGDHTHELTMPLLAPDQIKKMYAYGLKMNENLIKRCASYGVDICMQGQDFGMNTSTIMSPETIRDVFFPFIKQVNQLTIDNGMVPFFHSCGNIWKILDDFVDAGYKGYQSIQESAGMDNKTMKEKYGDKLTLWTGVQCETLIEGTLAQTREEVEKNLKLLMPGGGFMFGSTNSVQYGAKTENYLQALDVVREKGIYR